MKIGLIGIVGEEMKADLFGTLEKIAGIGYAGVEAAEGHLLKGDVAANRERFRGSGLQFLTTSASREALRDDFDTVLSNALAVGAPRVSMWWSEADSHDNILRDAELYNTAGAKLQREGIRLCYHNHDQEFRNVIDGVYALDLIAANTDPKALFFTIDVGWVCVGGEDPVRVLNRLGSRVAAIHLKDFADFGDRTSFTTVGTGAVPMAECIAAARKIGIEWGVVEQDRLRNLTAMETIETSFRYLKERGLT